MLPSSSPSFSAASAVPSGLPSSTTRMRASGATARTARSSRSMLSISLYVGTTTVARTVGEPTLTA